MFRGTPPSSHVTKLGTAQRDLTSRKASSTVKEAYRKKVKMNLEDNSSRWVWKGIQHLMNYKGNSPGIVNANASLAEELNHLFARFESSRPATAPVSHPASSSHALTLQVHQVRHSLKVVKPRKAAGPDGVLGKVLYAFADQLVS